VLRFPNPSRLASDLAMSTEDSAVVVKRGDDDVSEAEVKEIEKVCLPIESPSVSMIGTEGREQVPSETSTYSQYVNPKDLHDAMDVDVEHHEPDKSTQLGDDVGSKSSSESEDDGDGMATIETHSSKFEGKVDQLLEDDSTKLSSHLSGVEEGVDRMNIVESTMPRSGSAYEGEDENEEDGEEEVGQGKDEEGKDEEDVSKDEEDVSMDSTKLSSHLSEVEEGVDQMNIVQSTSPRSGSAYGEGEDENEEDGEGEVGQGKDEEGKDEEGKDEEDVSMDSDDEKSESVNGNEVGPPPNSSIHDATLFLPRRSLRNAAAKKILYTTVATPPKLSNVKRKPVVKEDAILLQVNVSNLYSGKAQ
jgi:hypothetical protein